ncbi:MAG TPA: energy transducer TonB, partial [Pyrinomonadaceae bacterium]
PQRGAQKAAAAAPPAANTQPAAQPPAAGGAPKGPVSVGSLVGKARQRVSPSYPPIARAARVSGSVTVFLIVGEKGDVESVSRADGPQQLQQAAVEAARRWKFNPTVVDGQPVRVSGFISFNFAL